MNIKQLSKQIVHMIGNDSKNQRDYVESLITSALEEWVKRKYEDEYGDTINGKKINKNFIFGFNQCRNQILKAAGVQNGK